MTTPGSRFRQAINSEQPLQIVGTINAYCAMLAKDAGYKAIYLSGAGVANAAYGLPDLAITSLDNVLEDAQRITGACDLPLLVDIDTGFGSAFNIARTIKQMQRAQVAAVHMEDQVAVKRCGHRPGKRLVSTAEMCDRIKAALDARTDDSFVIMARTDAIAVEGLEPAIERAQRYVEAGADMIFVEAMTQISQIQSVTDQISSPILINLTEFGKTPYFTIDELKQTKIAMALYPLSAFRAMSFAAQTVYSTIRAKGTQQSLLDHMQTRADLYKTLDYLTYEHYIDALNKQT